MSHYCLTEAKILRKLQTLQCVRVRVHVHVCVCVHVHMCVRGCVCVVKV